VEPINQISESEDLIPGLCTFLLGICYEFNREPGEITRYVFFVLRLSRVFISAYSTALPSIPSSLGWA
jgi:hypothetical protein